jgi:hypothetical protein
VFADDGLPRTPPSVADATLNLFFILGPGRQNILEGTLTSLTLASPPETSVPEPSTLSLFVVAGVPLVAFTRKRKRRAVAASPLMLARGATA